LPPFTYSIGPQPIVIGLGVFDNSDRRPLPRFAGFEATWFQKGLACARAVERGDFNLCLFDWMVPDISGPDVFTTIQLKLKETTPQGMF